MSDVKYDKIDDDAGEGSGKSKKCLCYTLLIGVIVVAAVVIVIVVVSNGSSGDTTDQNNYSATEQSGTDQNIFTAKLQMEQPDTNADDVTTLVFTAQSINSSIAHMTLIPDGETATTGSWKVPNEWLPRLTPATETSLKNAMNFETIDKEANGKFWFRFENQNTEEDIIFTTENRALTFTNEKSQIGYTLPTQKIFGFGERTMNFGLKEGDYTAFARDRYAGTPSEAKGNDNTYGEHPFIIWQIDEKKNMFAGMVALTTRALNLNVKFLSNGKSTVTFTQVGGAIEFYYFTAGTAISIVQQYSRLVGTPALPPFWSLGFHLCSWKWENIDQMKEALQKTLDAGFVLETQWVDIPYMNDFMDFTVDDEGDGKFVGLGEFVTETLHANGRKFVPIIDAGIGPDTDPFWQEGVDKGIFIKKADGSGDPYVGKVWPGKASYPDYTNPDAQAYFSSGFERLYDKVKFDGIWLDMNEPADMSQEKKPEPTPPEAFLKSVTATLEADDEEEIIPGITWLGEKTVPLDTIHMGNYKGTQYPENQLTEMDWHSLYGAMEAEATFNWMESAATGDFKDRKHFIVSRSTFPGSGRYNQHWLGDNQSDWENIRYAVAGTYNFNLFQIPFVGPDIGGFGGNISDAAVNDDKGELFLARFHQVGAFFPFSRNHNNIGDYDVEKKEVITPSEEQGPWIIAEPKYRSGVQQAFKQRYALLRHYYTQLYISSVLGTPFYLPTYFHYPEEMGTQSNYEQVVMLGDALAIVLPLDKEETIKAYIPGTGRWFRHFGQIKGEGDDLVDYVAGGTEITISDTWTDVAVLQKEGTVVATQNPDGVQVTDDLTKDGAFLTYTIFPTADKQASGNVYLAYGKYKTSGEGNVENEQLWRIYYNARTITFDDHLKDEIVQERINDNNVIGQINVVGIDYEGLEGKEFVCAQLFSGNDQALKGTYNKAKQTMVITKNNDEDPNIEIQNIQEINFGVEGQDFNPCKPAYVTSEVTTTDNVTTFKLKPSEDNALADILVPLTGTAKVVDQKVIRIEITQDGETNFRVPFEPAHLEASAEPNIETIVRISPVDSPFELTLTTANNEEIIKIDNFTFTKQYLRMEETVSGRNLIGFGERVHKFELTNGQYTMWALDNPAQYDQGKRTGDQGYGVHPVYFARRNNNNNYFGLFNLNSSSQQVTLKDEGNNRKIVHELTSGMIDLFFITEGTYEDTVKNYHKIVGRPVLPPMWGLGWQQSQYGYESTDKMNEAVTKYAEFGIPLDVMWSDIDFMENKQDFTIGTGDNYKDLPTVVKQWQDERGLRWVPIVDAGIGTQFPEDEVYKTGLDQQVYIKSPSDDKPLLGEVWPGEAVFPDFTKAVTGTWWRKAFTDFRAKIHFDGVWLDMNEVANFIEGSNDAQKVPDSILDTMILFPGLTSPNYKSLQVDAYHNDDKTQMEYDYHNLYGYLQSQETVKFFSELETPERPFIISRSTFAGSGKWVSHWLGDNHSNYSSMKTTTAGVMLLNTFGYSLVGGDICGFMDNTTPELCTRWTNIGAFYPFARNHNTLGATEQAPYVFEEALREQQTKAIKLRYEAIRYIYQWIWKANQLGGTVWRPQSANYPGDEAAYAEPEENAMIGDGLKIAAVYEDRNTYSFYFPAQFRNIERPDQFVTGQAEIATTVNDINLFIAQQKIVQWQYPTPAKEGNSLTTKDLDNARTSLKMFHTASGQVATGSILLDDGMSLDTTKATHIEASVTFTSPFLRTGRVEGTFTIVQEEADKTEFKEYEKLGKMEFLNFSLYNWGDQKEMQFNMVTGFEPATINCPGALGPRDVFIVDCTEQDIPLAKINTFTNNI